jgi:hypothetical protein
MPNFIIKLRHPKQTSEKSSFWEEFYNSADRVRGEYTMRDEFRVLEGRIKTNFPHELKRFLNTFTPPISTIGPESKTNLSASIAIAIEYIKEGSLELGLIFEPVENLAKIFENNFDYFETFLRSYIPIAFYNSLRPQYQADSIGWRDTVDQLEFEIAPTNEFRNHFQSKNKSQNQPGRNNSITTKANWLWVISNTSLVVPVLIISLILYFTFIRLTTKEDRLERRYDKLIEQQNNLLNQIIFELDSTKMYKNK